MRCPSGENARELTQEVCQVNRLIMTSCGIPHANRVIPRGGCDALSIRRETLRQWQLRGEGLSNSMVPDSLSHPNSIMSPKPSRRNSTS